MKKWVVYIPMSVQFVTFNAAQAGQRLDNFLITKLKGVPKSHIYRLLRKGEVRINKKRVKPDYRIQEGDLLRLPPVRVAESDAPHKVHDRVLQLIADSILYEDDGMLVLNKPSGMAVHGGSGVSYGVIEALRALRPDEARLELVHRLDKETSGCLMIAKSRPALVYLHAQLRERKVKKTYLALVEGRWPKAVHKVDLPLLKNQLASGERMVRVDTAQGVESLTTFQVVQYFKNATLLEAHPFTGRTHQIRVHTAATGHPICGDDKYGLKQPVQSARQIGLKRLFLHALRLQWINMDSGDRQTIEAPLAADLEQCVDKLGLDLLSKEEKA